MNGTLKALVFLFSFCGILGSSAAQAAQLKNPGLIEFSRVDIFVCQDDSSHQLIGISRYKEPQDLFRLTYKSRDKNGQELFSYSSDGIYKHEIFKSSHFESGDGRVVLDVQKMGHSLYEGTFKYFDTQLHVFCDALEDGLEVPRVSVGN